MNKRLSLLLATFASGLYLLSAQAQAETLLDIYQQARENDHIFQAAKADLDAGEQNSAINRAALLPQISASAFYTDYNESVTAQDITTDDDTTARGYSINLTQNIINLQVWYQAKVGGYLSDLAGAQYVQGMQGLILRTATAYFDALEAVDNLASANAEKESYSQQLEQTKQRFEVGLTAITEVHEAQARYDSAVANQLIAEGGLGIAFEALEVLTGKSYQSISPLKEDFPVVPPEPAAREPWVKQAQQNNADLKVAQYQRQTAAAAAKAAKAGHLPTLSGSLTYNDGNTDLPGQEPDYVERDGLTANLTLQVPIFTGGGVSASRRQAAAQALSAKELYLQTQRAVVQTTRASHLRVLTTAATVKALRQAIRSNQSALEATQAGYDVGTRDLVDVLNAQRLLFIAQRDYFEGLYNYVLTTLELKQAAGTLSEKDVVELNSWLNRERSVGLNSK